MKRTFIMSGILIALAAILMGGLWLYADRELKEASLSGGSMEEYDRHYMLVSADRSQQWQTIYASAREEAARQKVYLEWVGADLPEGYSASECMEIATAARPDGIILHPDREAGMTGLIDEAFEEGIPVVTVLNDDSASRRVSFIGVNSYQMGEIYGSRVLDVLDGASGRVLVLRSGTYEDNGGSLTYSQLLKTVETGKDAGQEVSIDHIEMNAANSFEAEEGIRDIFLDRNRMPDVIVCLDLTATECASQALVDFNEVGEVTVIGYYASEKVLDAIGKGVVDSTLKVDSEEIGRLCVSALDEYCALGNVSNYFTIGIEMISK